MTLSDNMHYLATAKVEGDLLRGEIKLGLDPEGQMDLLQAWRVDTIDKQIREGLILLGWTPPKTAEPTAEVEEMIEVCAGDLTQSERGVLARVAHTVLRWAKAESVARMHRAFADGGSNGILRELAKMKMELSNGE